MLRMHASKIVALRLYKKEMRELHGLLSGMACRPTGVNH